MVSSFVLPLLFHMCTSPLLSLEPSPMGLPRQGSSSRGNFSKEHQGLGASQRTSVQRWLKSQISNEFGVFKPHTKAGILSFEHFDVWLDVREHKHQREKIQEKEQVDLLNGDNLPNWVNLFVLHWDLGKQKVDYKTGKEWYYSSMGKKKKSRYFWQFFSFDIYFSAFYEAFPLSLEVGWSSELGTPWQGSCFGLLFKNSLLLLACWKLSWGSDFPYSTAVSLPSPALSSATN